MSQTISDLRENGVKLVASVGGIMREFAQLEDAQIQGVPVYRSELSVPGGRLVLTLQPKRDGRWFAGAAFKGTGTVETWIGVRIPVCFDAGSYTLVPGVYYDGNNSEPTGNIPALTEKRGMRFEAPAAACSIPVAMHFDGKGTVRVLSGAPFTRAGTSGFVVDAGKEADGEKTVRRGSANGSVAFMVPAVEEKRYTHGAFMDRSRPGCLMQDGDTLAFWFSHTTSKVDSIAGMFRLLNEKHRRVWGYGDRATSTDRTMSLQEASDAIADWLVDRHFVVHEGRAPIFLNAFAESSGTVYGKPNFPQDWMQIMGMARPAWREAAKRGIDAFCDLWERYGDFGFRVDKSGDRAEIIDGGTFAGAFALLAIAEGMRAFAGEDRYRRVFMAASESYHERFVAKVHCTAGPLDHLRADDSDAAAAIADAYTRGGFC